MLDFQHSCWIPAFAGMTVCGLWDNGKAWCIEEVVAESEPGG